MNADGSNVVLLTDAGSALSWGGTWSPDGNWIVATRWISSPTVILVPAVGGTNPIVVAADGYAPAWRP
jgi:Tol biopolymer transport system component